MDFIFDPIVNKLERMFDILKSRADAAKKNALIQQDEIIYCMNAIVLAGMPPLADLLK